MNSRIRAKKVRAKKFAAIAARSRQFTVKNNTIPKTGLNRKNIITNWKEIRTTQFDIPVRGKMFEIDKDGHYHLIEIDHSWKKQRHKQPKRLMTHKKTAKRVACNDFVRMFKNYPYTLSKMNKVQYCEKLVEHKLAKWERKNQKPMDMFVEDVEKWKQLRENAKERFRDFVVSVYDPLVLTGRFIVGKDNSATYQEKKIAEIKDINGEGHMVNDLPKNSKLMKKVQKITDHTKDKHPNLVCCYLKDHKRQRGRVILPKAA